MEGWEIHHPALFPGAVEAPSRLLPPPLMSW